MNVIIGPAKYIRKREVVKEAGDYIKEFGRTAAIIGGKKSLKIVEQDLQQSCAEYGVSWAGSIWYGGEASQTNIESLVEEVKARNIDVLVGTGGGKAIDTVKAVAYHANKPLVVIPTIAATCAAATPITILYNNEGEFVGISHESKAPDLVLVDSSIIIEAPVRFLAAGIGDTLAKWFETRASVKKAAPTALNQTAVSIASQLYQTLRDIGKEAVESADNGTLTPAVEDAIDAVILVSGSVSGYGGNDCRTAAAHAIYSGLTIFPEIHATYHGEIVAFGILAQLCLENKELSEIHGLIDYYQEVGLPFTLKQMGVGELTPEQWKELGAVTVTIEDMNNMPFQVTPEMVIEAVRRADEIGQSFLKIATK
jgi:glycerol dehydrogenase